ncbi:MAG: hypothetical protein QJR14_10500, partial [Bacillota bacterium]|nr:hypothetical protein [Bacillota bacterium]MDI3318029.1 hypothetical protein [Bacillota bacterium]
MRGLGATPLTFLPHGLRSVGGPASELESASEQAWPNGPRGDRGPEGTARRRKASLHKGARSFADAQALRAAWNGALDPFEADAELPPFQLDEGGRFLVFAGFHRLLAGQIQGTGWALDVLLDHPEQNGAAARQAI